MMKITYLCDICNGTKIIEQGTGITETVFLQNLPSSVPCGWQGCVGQAVRTDGVRVEITEHEILTNPAFGPFGLMTPLLKSFGIDTSREFHWYRDLETGSLIIRQ